VALFTVDWEPWYSFKPYGKFWEDNDPLVEEPTHYILDLLRRHEIKAIFYCVGWLKHRCPLLFSKIESEGHVIGDHTYYHRGPGSFEPFRAPRWAGEKRLYSGGFFLRAMPYAWLKREVEKTGVFFVHPHDLLWEHPCCGNKLKTFERRIGLKTSRDKLERLCREVVWNEPI